MQFPAEYLQLMPERCGAGVVCIRLASGKFIKYPDQ